MAAFTFATSCYDWNDTAAAFNTTGLVFKLYRDHFGTWPVRVSGNVPPPPPRYPLGGDQPQVNAGSDTYPLDVAAALSEDRRTLTLAVLNPTTSPQQATFALSGIVLRGGKSWQMTGPSPEAANLLGQAPQVQVTERTLDALPSTLTVDPLSINLFALDIG
jgi:alpha-L-arabinofuranosidase